MNIFVLSENPVEAAREQCDQHVVKMPCESAQLLCTALASVGISEPWMYEPTHRDVAISRWVRESRGNFEWLVEHGLALCSEYTRRYGREHASESIIRACSAIRFPVEGERTSFVQVMPDEYRNEDAVTAYRNFYQKAKVRFARWRHSEKPSWMPAFK